MGRVFFILTTLSLMLALLSGVGAAELGGKRRFADVDAAGNDDALEWLDGSASAHGRRGETWAAYPKIIWKTQPRASGR